MNIDYLLIKEINKNPSKTIKKTFNNPNEIDIPVLIRSPYNDISIHNGYLRACMRSLNLKYTMYYEKFRIINFVINEIFSNKQNICYLLYLDLFKIIIEYL
jgi:hypothetical protein